MGETSTGRDENNDKTLVARQGFEALMNDDDHIVGGDEATRQQVAYEGATSETVKAASHAERTRPG